MQDHLWSGDHLHYQVCKGKGREGNDLPLLQIVTSIGGGGGGEFWSKIHLSIDS